MPSTAPGAACRAAHSTGARAVPAPAPRHVPRRRTTVVGRRFPRRGCSGRPGLARLPGPGLEAKPLHDVRSEPKLPKSAAAAPARTHTGGSLVATVVGTGWVGGHCGPARGRAGRAGAHALGGARGGTAPPAGWDDREIRSPRPSSRAAGPARDHRRRAERSRPASPIPDVASAGRGPRGSRPARRGAGRRLGGLDRPLAAARGVAPGAARCGARVHPAR